MPRIGSTRIRPNGSTPITSRIKGGSAEDAAYIAQSLGNRYFPEDWTDYLASEQEMIDFMAKETGHKPFAAETLFDRRFETVAGQAYAAEPVSH